MDAAFIAHSSNHITLIMADPVWLALEGAKQAYGIVRFLHQSYKYRKQNPKDIKIIFSRVQVIKDSL